MFIFISKEYASLEDARPAPVLYGEGTIPILKLTEHFDMNRGGTGMSRLSG